MTGLRLTVSVAVAGVVLSGSANAEKVETEAHACAVLLEVVPGTNSAPKKSGDYYCRFSHLSSQHFVFGLHAIDPPPQSAGVPRERSDLVGWFAVRWKDGAVAEWDMANERPGKPIRARK